MNKKRMLYVLVNLYVTAEAQFHTAFIFFYACYAVGSTYSAFMYYHSFIQYNYKNEKKASNIYKKYLN